MATNGPRQVRLSTKPDPQELQALRLGDVVYLDGIIYTAREGVYMRALEQHEQLPVDLPSISAANFHCSPAATINDDGHYSLGAVTATASFRFAKWIGQWIEQMKVRLVIGKGGMTSAEYKAQFVPHGAIYLTTVGYGTGALLGRGVKGVQGVHWHKELGIAQAMWLLECQKIGPFMVASDSEGNCLFERENEKISQNLEKVYAGTKPAVLKRFGETDDRSEELI